MASFLGNEFDGVDVGFGHNDSIAQELFDRDPVARRELFIF